MLAPHKRQQPQSNQLTNRKFMRRPKRKMRATCALALEAHISVFPRTSRQPAGFPALYKYKEAKDSNNDSRQVFRAAAPVRTGAVRLKLVLVNPKLGDAHFAKPKDSK